MSDRLPPGHQHRHRQLVEMYVEERLGDPMLSLERCAAWCRMNPRTLRRSLDALGTSWRAILLERRLERGVELLERSTHHIDTVARLSGYKSAAAFGKVFRGRYGLSPREYRRAKKRPARAGGATGAFDHGRSRQRSYDSEEWVIRQQEAREEEQQRREQPGYVEEEHAPRGRTIDQIAEERLKVVLANLTPGGYNDIFDLVPVRSDPLADDPFRAERTNQIADRDDRS